MHSYAVINEIATKKILKPFMQEFFVTNDNVLNRSIEAFIEQQAFSRRQNLAIFASDIKKHVATFFAHDDKHKAKLLLVGEEGKMPRSAKSLI